MNNQILETQKLCSDILGFDHLSIEQGTEEWLRLKMGVVSASKAYILLMKDKPAPYPESVKIQTIKRGVNEVRYAGEAFTGSMADCKDWVRNKLPRIKSETKMTYLYELVAQIATGKIAQEIKAKPLQWGKDNEEAARDAYSSTSFETIDEYSFLYHDTSMRAGISPDGIIRGKDQGLELKCPWSSAVWCAFAIQGIIKHEEIVQCQFSMMITGFNSWSFAKYDPRNTNCKKLHHVIIKRDEEMIEQLREGLKSFIEDMDKALAVLGLTFGSQWK